MSGDDDRDLALGLSPETLADMDRRAAERRAREAQLAEEEAQLTETRRRQALIDAGVPALHLQRVLAGGAFRDTEAMAVARKALDRGWWLWVLAGPPGCGKTFAACWWLVQRRIAPKWVTTRELRFVTAAELTGWPRFKIEAMDTLRRASALVVDDLGSELGDKAGAFLSLLGDVLNARYANELPTILTTNSAADGFKARYGDRIVDRIREAGRFVEVTGPSLRRRRDP